MSHAWHKGIKLLEKAQLSTCRHCGTLRVEEDGRTRYIRSTYDPALRVSMIEPPCQRLPRKGGPPEFERPPERLTSEVGHG